MASTVFKSSNVNDILAASQRITTYNMLARNTRHQSWAQQAWVPFYVQPDLSNPTVFMCEYDSTLPGTAATLVWPAAVQPKTDGNDTVNNPFGITAAQGDPIFPAALQALLTDVPNFIGWTENNGGIGV